MLHIHPAKANSASLHRGITHLIEVENQIQLAHIAEETVQDFHKEVYRFQIREFIVIGIYAGAEEETCISTVYYLVVAELDKVGLVLLVSGGDKAVDLFWFVSIRN
jgi:hypothetical protein